MTVGRHQKENFYLKEEFIAYLQSKNLAPSSIESYLWSLQIFLAWIEKEEIQITKQDILKYLRHLKVQREQKIKSRSLTLNCLNHYFSFLQKKEEICINPCAFIRLRGEGNETRLRIYTGEELQQLYDKYYAFFVLNPVESRIAKNKLEQARLSKERNAVVLNILVHQGLTTKEVDTLQLCDIDLTRATMRIRGGAKLGCERNLQLEATQIGVLMHYVQHTRPQFLEYHKQESQQLFLCLPSSSREKVNNDNFSINRIFSRLKIQLKSIDKDFVNLTQIRASVISNWLNVHGLRKTQVRAGHKYISTTEGYRVNDLQQLTSDINSLHPFL